MVVYCNYVLYELFYTRAMEVVEINNKTRSYLVILKFWKANFTLVVNKLKILQLTKSTHDYLHWFKMLYLEKV